MPNTTKQRLTALGFTLQHTGGNCTAYGRPANDTQQLITLESDPSIPTRLSDIVTLAIYHRDNKGDGEFSQYRLSDLLAVLENDFCLCLECWKRRKTFSR